MNIRDRGSKFSLIELFVVIEMRVAAASTAAVVMAAVVMAAVVVTKLVFGSVTFVERVLVILEIDMKMNLNY